jgi:hypothetical protein
MEATNVVVGIVAFVAVAGYTVLAWLRRGRDPTSLDDQSIFLPAPPPGMTAATAAMIIDRDPRTAFMAALLDLASRDEIAFVVEGQQRGVDLIGLAIHGGESTDPRVRLNRRNPIGEAEEWLLGELKAYVAAVEAGPQRQGDVTPAQMQAGLELMSAIMRSVLARGGDDDFAARAAREHGLVNQPVPDLTAVAAAYEAKHGRPIEDSTLAELGMMAALMSTLKEPQAMAGDPDAFLDEVESRSGRRLDSKERARAKDLLGQVADVPMAVGRSASNYLSAARARTLPATFIIGPLLQKYALRHGWLVGMPLFARIRWQVIGGVEVFVGLVVAAIASSASFNPFAAAGAGIAAGGVATYLMAPAMPSVSVEGSVMRAQLAAYRRTLQASLAGATSLRDVAASSRLSWLETPDETVVWAVALGLRADLEALLRRLPQEADEAFALGPSGSPVATPGASGSVAASSGNAASMFAGIEAIGTASLPAPRGS